MNNLKNIFKIVTIMVLLIVTVNLRNVNAQDTFFSISELKFTIIEDSTINESNKLLVLNLRISDVSLASEIHVELAENMPEFTLLKEQGTFITENGNYYIEVNGSRQIIYDKHVSFYFEIPTDVIEKWKFTRVYIDLHSGESSKYLYHRR